MKQSELCLVRRMSINQWKYGTSNLSKCFHVELVETPSRSKVVILSRARGADGHSATIRWKHIGKLLREHEVVYLLLFMSSTWLGNVCLPWSTKNKLSLRFHPIFPRLVVTTNHMPKRPSPLV